MWIPGFGSDEIRPFKKACTTEAHKQVSGKCCCQMLHGFNFKKALLTYAYTVFIFSSREWHWSVRQPKSSKTAESLRCIHFVYFCVYYWSFQRGGGQINSVTLSLPKCFTIHSCEYSPVQLFSARIWQKKWDFYLQFRLQQHLISMHVLKYLDVLITDWCKKTKKKKQRVKCCPLARNDNQKHCDYSCDSMHLF